MDSGINPADPEDVRARLKAMRVDLEAVIATSKDARAAVELDQTKVGRVSRIDALQGQQMALATDRRRTLSLQMIDSALKRLDAGDYGFCTRCDEPIDPKRLTFDPATPFCIACARENTGVE
jgi:DnaK suppressor protein